MISFSGLLEISSPVFNLYIIDYCINFVALNSNISDMKKYNITVLTDNNGHTSIIDDFDVDIPVDVLCFDISKISDLLQKQDLNEYSLSPLTYRFTRLYESEYKEFIHKRDKHSVPIEEVKSEILTRFNMLPEQFNKVRVAHGIELAVIFPDREDVKEDIIRCMDYLNWNLSTETYVVHKTRYREHRYIQLRFEPMYSHNVNDLVRKTGKLYHITLESNIKSIKEKGLLPKSKNWRFKYPERVYFVKGDTSKRDLKLIASTLYDERPDYNNEHIICLIIDVNTIGNDVDFYLDSMFEYGVYTYNEIPSSSIISVKIINDSNISFTGRLKEIIKKFSSFNLFI